MNTARPAIDCIVAKKATRTGAEIYVWSYSFDGSHPSYCNSREYAVKLRRQTAENLAAKIGGYVIQKETT